jgi:hypothetical protein
MALPAPTVVLLTDFGNDPYVGVMKGVILSRCPEARLVDLTNHVGPGNVREGAWLLLANYAYFPPCSIFLAVVDPGVGTARKALAVRAGSYFFIGPDNGLLYPAVADAGIEEIIALPVPKHAARTFHGRDVFAPAAARIAAGVPLGKIDTQVVPVVRLKFFRKGRDGEVVTIDRFGNVITNLPPLAQRESYRVQFSHPGGDEYFEGELAYRATYAAVPNAAKREPFIITSSSGTLEVALRGTAAAPRIGVLVGDRVRID